ncbi:LacI family DNA-binding transcriptional regulator [Streptomyces spiralis]
MAGTTLRDVAKRAGVSIRTVSNVVNGSVPVSDELRTRVEAALEELDYRPNLVARNLRRGRTGMIALVVPELDVPYFAELAREVITAARAHGYVVMLDQTDGDGERERELLGRESRATMFDGLLLSPLTISAEELRSRTNKVPVVLLGEHIFNGDFHHVAIDNIAAAREATEHLLGQGRRRIAAVGDQPYSTGETAQLRTIGYGQALERAGVAVDEDLVVPNPPIPLPFCDEAHERHPNHPHPPDPG